MSQLVRLVVPIILVVGALFVTTSAFCGIQKGACDDGFAYGYPFSSVRDLSDGDCGYPGLSINCSKEGRPVMNVSNNLYYILDIDNRNKSFRVVEMDVDDQECPRPTRNISLETASPSLSSLYAQNPNITYFYNCSSYPKNVVQQHSCLDNYYNNSAGGRSFAFLQKQNTTSYGFNWYGNCKENVVVPVTDLFNNSDYKRALKLGFDLVWSTPDECKGCENSGGQCWYNETSTVRPVCSCQNGIETKLFDTICPSGWKNKTASQGTTNTIQPPPIGTTNTSQLPPKGPTNTTQFPPKGAIDISQQNHQTGIRTELKIIIGVCSGVGGVVGLLLIILFIYRQKLSSLYASIVSHWKHKIIKPPTNVEAFLEKGGGLGLQKYSYSQIKKMTNSFKETLGEGGFGSVFKGKLHDGRLVAVKVLNESKGKGDDFINEVATIGRTNHVNVVSLLGFCSTGPKQALVYEFMLNGSLEKFIYNRKNASITNPPLGWEKLYQIALGIAKGLEYLHCGCNTRILHFDIKPHNILLDQDFCPKISDFGLAKLCQGRESNVSMHVARGTMGYIAPEVSCINFGRASHKSDVYSYGMMVFEMIGGRKNIDTSVENISEIYFPQWIYSHFKQDIDIDECREIFKEETTRKMIKVALWSIQPQPADRPSISKVVEMLEGNVDELEMPPNPFHDPP